MLELLLLLKLELLLLLKLELLFSPDSFLLSYEPVLTVPLLLYPDLLTL